jgi:hypothetical protein
VGSDRTISYNRGTSNVKIMVLTRESALNILTPEFFLGQTIFFMESVDLFLESEFMKPASVFFGLSFGGGTDFSVAIFFPLN